MAYKEQQEDFEAGLAGNAQRHGHTDAFQRGQGEREAKQKAGADSRDSTGGIGGLLIVFAIAALLIFFAFVFTAAIAAIFSAPLLMLAARAWRSPALPLAEAYKASLMTVLVALIIGAAIIAAAVWTQRGDLDIERDLVRPTVKALIIGIDLFGRTVNGDTTWWPTFSLSGLSTLDPAVKLYAMVAALIFLGPILLGSAFALWGFANHSFKGFTGFLRAFVTAPFVVFPGILLAFILLIAGGWMIQKVF